VSYPEWGNQGINWELREKQKKGCNGQPNQFLDGVADAIFDPKGFKCLAVCSLKTIHNIYRQTLTNT
jgi:hypothetical protein